MTTQNLETIDPQQATAPAAGMTAIVQDSGFMPMLTIQEAQRRFNALKQFVRENLRKDVDFGSIPGTGDKPTLLKPGAEKLCTFFGLRSQFEAIEHTEDWDKGLFYYWYKCRLFRGDRCIAEGDGSANSYERKYRWRTVPLFKATEDEKGRAVREETRRSRDGRLFKMLVLENDDPYSLINTLQKMAQKRALIAATLIAVNASEFFTQDMEDLVLDADVVDAPRAAEETEGGGKRHFAGADVEPAGSGRGRVNGQPRARRGEGARTEPANDEGQQAELFPEEQPEELTLKFRERPSQDTLSQLKGAGFRWDPKKVHWHAPATAERLTLVEELARGGALS